MRTGLKEAKCSQNRIINNKGGQDVDKKVS